MKNNNLAKLTPKQIKALPLMVGGMSSSEIAQIQSVSEVQLSKWKKDKNFMAVLDGERKEALSEAKKVLSGLTVKAVDVLKQSLQSNNENIRLKAAIYLLDTSQSSVTSLTTEYEEYGEIDINDLYKSLGLLE